MSEKGRRRMRFYRFLRDIVTVIGIVLSCIAAALCMVVGAGVLCVGHFIRTIGTALVIVGTFLVAGKSAALDVMIDMKPWAQHLDHLLQEGKDARHNQG